MIAVAAAAAKIESFRMSVSFLLVKA